MEVVKKGDEIIFRDGVHLVRGSDTIDATEMRTTQRRDKVTAKDKVVFKRILSTTERLVGSGTRAFYDAENGSGYIVGGFSRAHVVRTEVVSSTLTRRLDLMARRFDFDRDGRTAVATGAVYGKTVDPADGSVYEFWSDRAVYLDDEKKLVLTGKKQPRMKQSLAGAERRVLSGDMIEYSISTQRLVSRGRARTDLERPDGKRRRR